MSDHDILTLVRQRARALDRALRWRDVREIIGGLIVAAIVAPAMPHGPWLTRVGAMVVIAGCAIVVTMLMRARHSLPSYDEPLTGAVRSEIAKLDAQIRLLETVVWWYIIPLSVGPALIVAGASGASWFTTIYLASDALLAWGIYTLNRRTLGRSLHPRRIELERLLQSLETHGD